MPVELFATATCPYCSEVRDQLELDGIDFVEHDVERDREARERLTRLLGAAAMVPVVVDGGRVTQIGVSGRGCYVTAG